MARPAAIGSIVAAVLALIACTAVAVGQDAGNSSDPPDHDAKSSTITPGHDSRHTAPESSPWLRFDDAGPYDALAAWFPPYFIHAGVELKDFIRSDEFAAYRRYAGDARAVDAIYVRAMSLTGNNTSLALLAAAVATFDHDIVGLDNPLLALYLPLSSEPRAEFEARVRNLPSDFYSDTPPGPNGDRDKLQHFFGAAWIALTFESRGAAERVGEFVETGEDAVIVGGVLDNRDRRANWNGTEFGIALLSNNRRYPSEFFKTPIVEGAASARSPLDSQTGCR